MSMISTGWTMQNIKLGGLNIDPFVSTEGKYDSNIYLQSNAKGAWINDSAVGVRFSQKFSNRLKLQAGYQLDLITYSVSPSNNNAVHHTADISGTATVGKDINMKLGEKFLATTDQASSELTARAKRVENDVNFLLESPLKGNYGFRVEVADAYNKYLATEYAALDRNQVTVGVAGTYKLMPQTLAVLGYNFNNVAYKSNTANNSTINKINGGLEGKIANKVTGTVSAGAQFRNYKNSLNTASNNATTFSYGLGLSWQATENSTLLLQGIRDNIESTYVNSRYYTSTLTNLIFNHKIGTKWDVGAAFGYEYVVYPENTPGLNEKRKDGYLRLGVDVGYDIQPWLKAALAYDYKNRSSNEGQFNYKDHVTGLQIRATF